MRKLLLLFVLAVSLSNLVYSQTGTDWKWLHPSPQGNQLRAIQAFSASTWYAVGLAGTFMKTTDAGATWTFNHLAGLPFGTSGQSSNAYDLNFTDLNNGIVVGSTAGILKTTDGGNSWTPVPSGILTTTISFFAVDFDVNNLIGYAVGSTGRIAKTTNGGASWDSVASGVTTTFNDVWTNDGTTVFIATTAGNLRKSTDGGATWTAVYTGVSYTVQKIEGDGTTFMAAGTAGNVRVSTDGGTTWAAANTGLAAANVYWDIDYLNNTFYLTGPSFNLYKSTNLGVSWDTLALLNPGQPWTSTFYSSVFSPTGDSVITVGGFGLIQSRFGATATPTNHTRLIKPGTWYDVWSSAPDGNVIAVGAPTVGGVQDQVARSTNGGGTWTLVPMPAYSTATFWSIDMLDNNNGFISGTNSAIYKTTNGGVSWDSVATTGIPAGTTLRKIDFVSPTVGWVFAGAPSTLTNFIFKTTDGGATWTAQSHGIAAASAGQVYGANMLNENYGVLVTWEPRPYTTRDGGATWVRDSTSDNHGGFLYDVKVIDTTLSYAVGSSGRIYKKVNGSTVWDLIPNPTGTSYSFNSLEVYSPNTFSVFGATGTFLLTTDAGLTWSVKNTSGATLQGSHFSMSNNNTYAWFAVGANGFMFKNTLSIVPVELASLSATVAGTDVNLMWTTASELNNNGFEIERKSGEGSWSKVAFVKGNGTTTKISEYAYTDKGVKTGKYQYRLKQIDFDGSFSYSYAVEVEVGTPMTFELSQNFPNPFNPTTTISYRIPETSGVTLKIFDVTGTEVMTLVNQKQEAGSYTINFDATNFASGMYIYKIEAGKYSSVKKMMLMK
ncbi:MAG: T9SS type A sorting domain-containing protein [Ignavibacteria bacterium]|nr:T9SS type A sorting domain-containing protein [Ignavibacteria bacterium]